MSEVNSIINKSMEQSAINGALRGGVYVGIEYVRKQTKLGKNVNIMGRNLIIVSEMVLVELFFNFADKKGWLKWSKV